MGLGRWLIFRFFFLLLKVEGSPHEACKERIPECLWENFRQIPWKRTFLRHSHQKPVKFHVVMLWKQYSQVRTLKKWLALWTCNSCLQLGFLRRAGLFSTQKRQLGKVQPRGFPAGIFPEPWLPISCLSSQSLFLKHGKIRQVTSGDQNTSDSFIILA